MFKSNNNPLAKPFIKWAGGKGKLISQLEPLLPIGFSEQEDVCYIEPFVGGGAMLFHMLQNHSNIQRAIINDINKDLINCYRIIKNNPKELIQILNGLQTDYLSAANETKSIIYYEYRNEYNGKGKKLSNTERAALFIFLNKTCFNGLYRVNLKGEFNVPIGRYQNPLICNEDNIWAVHELLKDKNVTILCGDYKETYEFVNDPEDTFFYFDPPYRPLLGETNFKDYNESPFGDAQQEELRDFCHQLTQDGIKWMQSNSDSRNEDGSSYFENLYEGDHFDILYAPRAINAFANGRGKLTESLIRNYNC